MRHQVGNAVEDPARPGALGPSQGEAVTGDVAGERRRQRRSGMMQPAGLADQRRGGEPDHHAPPGGRRPLHRDRGAQGGALGIVVRTLALRRSRVGAQRQGADRRRRPEQAGSGLHGFRHRLQRRTGIGGAGRAEADRTAALGNTPAPVQLVQPGPGPGRQRRGSTGRIAFPVVQVFAAPEVDRLQGGNRGAHRGHDVPWVYLPGRDRCGPDGGALRRQGGGQASRQLGEQRHQQGGAGSLALGVLRRGEGALEVVGVEAVAVEADHRGGRAAGGIGGEASAPRRVGEGLCRFLLKIFMGSEQEYIDGSRASMQSLRLKIFLQPNAFAGGRLGYGTAIRRSTR
ncbi:hypothetical protein CRT60_03425 [Azospirillum palustre]|uniref:Uncharacterized protein n=1 Tax=Azospirillum palustre TaxID=2044885 RepID=A0A2B8BMF6_9PROT|nr:hypothetical protein CRT60_03425 [Azospirillum palustre]